MPYSKLLSTQDPGCIVLLIDQSGSMAGSFAGDRQLTKATECAKAVNRVLRETALACTAGAAVRARCFVGVIGYGASVGSVFSGALAGKELASIADVATSPLRVDMLAQRVPDGAGGLVEQMNPFPVWIEPAADNGTPMAEAFALAQRWLQGWVQQRPSGFPPIVINITDGVPNDPSATAAAANGVRAISTSDGATLILNAHLSETRASPVTLPAPGYQLPDDYAKFLFDLSSPLPDLMLNKAAQTGFKPEPGARGFVYNADVDTLVRLLAFGSNPGLH